VSFDDLLKNGSGCEKMYGMWGTTSGIFNDHQPKSAATLKVFFAGYYGVIVRTNHFVNAGGNAATLDYGPPTTAARIEDGTSNTAMATEKRMRLDLLHEQPAWDDRGWSDGWDFDTIKTGLCQPLADDPIAKPGHTDACSPGSSHTSGLNVLLADGSVQFTSFDVNLETWNSMAHRSDGEAPAR
jgi:prepilin-type processing-associated H-X9-DG protein